MVICAQTCESFTSNTVVFISSSYSICFVPFCIQYAKTYTQLISIKICLYIIAHILK